MALQRYHDFVIAQKKEQEAEIGELKKNIAALEGETKEQQAAKERLAAEKDFNEKFTHIQANFLNRRKRKCTSRTSWSSA